MKKILFTILTFFIAIIFTTAEEIIEIPPYVRPIPDTTPEHLYPYVKPITGTPNKCIPITGNGKNKGDEIACGTEHFYVIANQDGMIKAIAKYNLKLNTISERITFTGKFDYSIPAIKEKLQQGYSYAYIISKNYSGTNESNSVIVEKDNLGTYNYFSNYSYDISQRHEILEEKGVQDKLSEGYRPIDYIYSDGYIGLILKKSNDLENKTLLLDGTEMTEEELLNLDEVKEILNQGYEYDSNSRDFNNYNRYNNEYHYLFRYVFFTKRTNKYENINQLTTNSPIQVIDDSEDYNDLENKKYNYPMENVINLYKRLSEKDRISYYTFARRYEDLVLDFFAQNDNVIYYLLSYYNTLRTNGYDIRNIDLLGLEDLALLAGDEYYEDLLEDTSIEKRDEIIEEIKTTIEKKYSFISSEKYWTRIEYWPYSSQFLACIENNNFNFSDLNSKLASSKRCQGSGLRPTITLSASNIEYSIGIKTDGNGTVLASKKTANESEEITFEVKPKEGYTLNEIKVTDQDGNVVIFKDYKFTMPSSNVLIEATFVAENPNTMTFISLGILITFILSLLIVSINKKKYDKALENRM